LFSARLEPLEDGAEIDLICRKRCKAARSSKPQYRTNAMGPSDHADSRARPSMGPAMDPYNSVGWVAWLASPPSLQPVKTGVTNDRMLTTKTVSSRITRPPFRFSELQSRQLRGETSGGIRRSSHGAGLRTGSLWHLAQPL